MAIASLNRFSVPTDGQNTGLLMPKLKYRFRVTLDGFGVAGTASTELTKQVMNVTRPEVTFEEIKLAVYNSTIKLAGRHSFADAKLTVRDDVTGNVSKKVAEQLQKQFDFYEQSGAASGIDYKFTMRVEILDGGNGAYDAGILEAFEFAGCFLKGAVYQGGDYTSNDPLDIALTITYDNAVQVDAAGALSGLGESVGRTVRTLALG
jgi:hypothetical protein